MTREEIVRNLLTELIDMIDNGSQRDLDRADEIGTSIIELLEQEPCEDTNANQHNSNALNDVGQHTNALDAISRQAVLDLIADYDLSMGQVVRGIHALPSVKPQEPCERWLRSKKVRKQMQIVIDIDEYDYNLIQGNNCCGILSHEIYNAIKNGTPLPKGHGRLITEPTAEEIEETIGGKNDFAECIRDAVKTVFDNAPTIIEADKAETR